MDLSLSQRLDLTFLVGFVVFDGVLSFLVNLPFLSALHAAVRLVHLDESPSQLARETIPSCYLDKIHCRLDPHYPTSFATASSMSLKVAHPHDLEIRSHQTS
jgi:hypothetical protein